jgi:hypothetical protein
MRHWWTWLLIVAPAAVLLTQMVPLLVSIPCLDSWSFVQQYRELMEDRYSWERFFAPNYVHPSAVGKSIYFAVLHYLGGNVAVLPVLGWVFSAIIALCVYRLARPLWKAGWFPAALVLCCATAIIFTAAQGEVWLWDFVYQNFIPGTCLAVGTWLLLAQPLSPWKILIAAILSVISIHSFGAGYFVPMLFCLPIWYGMQGQSFGRKLAFTLCWLLAHGVIAYFALTAPGGSDKGPDGAAGLAAIFDRPVMRTQFVLIVLGGMLGKGTVIEPETLCAVLGGVLLGIFLACAAFVLRHRKDRELITTSLPWIVFALYGLGSAGLISLGRMHNSVDNALDERFGTFSVFFVFGTLLLAATVLQEMATSGSSWFPYMRRAAAPAFALLVGALLINWHLGINLMHLKHSRMDQERALLTFARVMSLENNEWMDARITRKSSFGLSSFLADRGKLQGVQFAPDRTLGSFKMGKKLSAKWARFNPPIDTRDGKWKLTGLGGLSVDDVADLILITAQGANGPEEVVALAATLMPATFYERQKEVRANPEFYVGWTRTLDDSSLPKGVVTLRAYVFDQDKRVVHPIEGVHRLRDDNVGASIGVHRQAAGSGSAASKPL